MDAEAIQKCKAKEKSDLTLARDAFQHWVDKGRKVTLDGHPDIKTKKDAITFIRVLLPKLSVGGPKVGT